MPIPKDILAVKRPKNTIVIAYGKNKDHYAVWQRVGCRYENMKMAVIFLLTVPPSDTSLITSMSQSTMLNLPAYLMHLST